MEFTLALSELPYLHQNRDIAIVELLLIGHDADGPMTAELRAPSGVTSTIELTPASDLGGQMAGSSGGAFAAGVPLGDWRLKLRRASSGDWRSLDSTALNGFTVVAIYDATRS
jgi:hypothetical protein